MADSAYLYSDDRPDAWTKPETGFYDSRWVFPLAWFSFFKPSDVLLVNVGFDLEKLQARYGDEALEGWREVRLVADKAAALTQFKLRTPLLMSIVGDRLGAKEIQDFLSTVGGRPGRYLFVDPDEVLSGINCDFEDDEGHAKRIAGILKALGDGSISAQAAVELTSPYVKEFSADPDRFEGQILGYTYTWSPGYFGWRKPRGK